MKVCKFGGTSMAAAEQFEKVINIIRQDDARRMVVVSAPGKRSREDEKITDMLIHCSEVDPLSDAFARTFKQIKDRYFSISQHFGLNDVLSKEFDKIEQTIAEGTNKDYIVSRGEYLNAQMMAHVLGYTCIDAADIIQLTDRGLIDESSYERISSELKPGKNYVLPGFYGIDTAGNIKTFSRGGSDITGALIASAVQADVYENWTDVSGLMMADPRIVENPPVVPEITYTEIRELAALGANVFHEEAIAPIRKSHIPINIKNTDRPQDAGTFIRNRRDSSQFPLVGASAKRGYSRVTFTKFLLAHHTDFIGRVRQSLEHSGFSIGHELMGLDTYTFFIQYAEQNSRNRDTLLKQVGEDADADGVIIQHDASIIGVVGLGLDDREACSPFLGLDLLQSLRQNGISPAAVNIGGSPYTMLVSVSDEQTIPALQILTGKAAELNAAELSSTEHDAAEHDAAGKKS